MNYKSKFRLWFENIELRHLLGNIMTNLDVPLFLDQALFYLTSSIIENRNRDHKQSTYYEREAIKTEGGFHKCSPILVMNAIWSPLSQLLAHVYTCLILGRSMPTMNFHRLPVKLVTLNLMRNYKFVMIERRKKVNSKAE